MSDRRRGIIRAYRTWADGAIATIAKWDRHLDRAAYEQRVRNELHLKQQSAINNHTVRLILNDLLNEGNKSINNIDSQFRRFKDHIRSIINHSRADYENLLTGDVLTVEDEALNLALENENYHSLFAGTPTTTNTEELEAYYTQAGNRINTFIDKYRIQALSSMRQTIEIASSDKNTSDVRHAKRHAQKWDTTAINENIDTEIKNRVTTREEFDQAHTAKNLSEFLQSVQNNDTPEYLQQLVDDFVKTHSISFHNLSNNARQNLRPLLQGAIKSIAESITNPNAVIYVRGAVDSEWKTIKKLTPEEFTSWMNRMFVDDRGRFVIDYEDAKHYSLTSGDVDYAAPAYIFNELHLDISSAPHKGGGNFCKYYYCGTDDRIRDWIRSRYQIADHIPTKADTDLMVPCAIHSILSGVRAKNGKPLTERQMLMLTDYLYTRIRTRYINLSSLAVIAEEIGMQIEVSDLNGTPTHKYAASGRKYSHYDPDYEFKWRVCDNSHNKAGVWFGQKSKSLCDEKIYKYIARIVLWDDHFFCNEKTPFDSKTSYELVNELLSRGELKPLNLLQQNIYSTVLEEYRVRTINWEETMFKTATEVLNGLTKFNQPYRGFDERIMGINRGNIQDKIDELDDSVLPQLGYKLFLDELIDKNINVLAVSSVPKNFIHQSIRGPRFLISRQGQIYGPTTILDRNSNHSAALSQIDLPIGKPHTVGSCEPEWIM